MRSSQWIILALLAAAVLPEVAHGLSYQVCDTIREEYVTATPRLEGTWPYYNLLYTCAGNLTLEGFSVDACVLNGTSCGQAAADAFCQYLGFEYNSIDLFTTEPAMAPALSMTGEWCVSPGNYADLGHPNRTQFETIVENSPGPFCEALTSVACVRSRATLGAALPAIRAAAAASPARAPRSGSPQPARTADVLVNPSTASAGRRMRSFVAE